MTVDDARLEAAAALRDLNHAFVGHHTDEEALLALAADARAAADRLRTGRRRDRLELMVTALRAADPGDPDSFAPATPGSGFSDRAVAGTTNPTSVEVEIEMEGDAPTDDVIGRFTFGDACEGAPGRAHGGMVAAVFDDVTGVIIGRIKEPAFTGELTVRFVQPVPVRERIELRTRLDGRERRKLFISGEMRAGGEVVATCKAIFITVDPTIFAGTPDPR